MTTENSASKTNGKKKSDADKPNGKPDAAAAAAAVESDADKARAARRAALVQNGRALYACMQDAGFTRDIVIELGESGKAGKAWEELEPAVMKVLMRIGLKFKPVRVPDAPTA